MHEEGIVITRANKLQTSFSLPGTPRNNSMTNSPNPNLSSNNPSCGSRRSIRKPSRHKSASNESFGPQLSWKSSCGMRKSLTCSNHALRLQQQQYMLSYSPSYLDAQADKLPYVDDSTAVSPAMSELDNSICFSNYNQNPFYIEYRGCWLHQRQNGMISPPPPPLPPPHGRATSNYDQPWGGSLLSSRVSSPPLGQSHNNYLSSTALNKDQELLRDAANRLNGVGYCTCVPNNVVRYQDYSFMRSRHNSYCSHASRWSYSSHVADPMQGLRSASSCLGESTGTRSCRNSLLLPQSVSANPVVSANGTEMHITSNVQDDCMTQNNIKSPTASLRILEGTSDLLSSDMVDRNSLPPDYLVSYTDLEINFTDK